ncbi:LLM class flavin-dependent oxidoreductase [Conexibacter woesei]|uniref:Luciferase-like, subgroup n=1 Tax=Conexibacter woesei (strain DSM 14684 / CCUG 47730 / CIP 108061 / JCM 11494 / NBRC 100937 / ID131577) TaxID=469383 RepID=D3F0T7_CONWI|nr:LLM class flavin-dependent oxidoreductase [Conexibacter woesei]ADB54021.1 Luciferase-like, subgroup [Conexibacter woesei DSM 14684]
MPVRPDIGVLLGSTQSPAETLAAARAAEQAGFDELWIGEDYFFNGGIATAGALLATTTLPVGLGIVPAVTRHPALLAMELATLAGMFPGRLHAGVGAGVFDWLDGMALRPRRPLGSVRDTLAFVRALLDGETVTAAHETFAAEAVALHHPPAERLPLYVGASGPKALETSGALADGTVLSVLAGVDYVRWARERIAAGGGGDDHRVVLYAFCAIDDDAAAARESLRELVGLYLLTGPRNPLTEVQGIADEAEALAAQGLDAAIPQIPDAWIDRLAIAGDADHCRARVAELAAAGADAIALCFPDGAPVEPAIARAADALLEPR